MTTPELVPMIIPTVMIPLTLVSVGISVVASFIAALFGIELKMEGPKKLLEVLLKPKVIASALLLNAIIMGGVYCWKWWSNYPRLLSTIESEMKERVKESELSYTDIPAVRTNFETHLLETKTPQKIDQVWKTETGAGSFRSALINQGRVFTGNDHGIISELDLMSGKVLRTFYTGTPASTEITIWKNQLFVGEGLHDTHHARIYRFDLKSGKFSGSYQTAGHTEAQPIVANHKGAHLLLVVAGADGLHAVDPETLDLKWQINIGHMDAAVLSDESGMIFVGTGREKHDEKKYKSYAAALDFETGKIKWQRELPASSWMRPVFVGNNVCYISGEIYFPSERGHVVCFEKTTGNHTVALNTTAPIASTPKVLDQSILFATIHGNVCRFDVEKKENLWCRDTNKGGTSFAGPSFYAKGNLVVYPSLTNGLFVFDATTGAELMNWRPDKTLGEWKKTYADVSIEEDLWIVSDNEGSIRALRPQFLPEMVQSK